MKKAPANTINRTRMKKASMAKMKKAATKLKVGRPRNIKSADERRKEVLTEKFKDYKGPKGKGLKVSGRKTAPAKFNAKLKAASKAGKLSGKFKAAVDAAPVKMKKMKASAATMKKAAMKLKKESAMKLKKSGMMMKKAAMMMKKASAMKMKMKK